jgi:hypothetical protein
MNEYQVTWVVDVDADNPQDAAAKALEMQRDPSSTALVFEVGEILPYGVESPGEVVDLYAEEGWKTQAHREGCEGVEI